MSHSTGPIVILFTGLRTLPEDPILPPVFQQSVSPAGRAAFDCSERFYATEISTLEAAGEIHRAFFERIRLASTIVEVSAPGNPSLMAEMEANAVVIEGSK